LESRILELEREIGEAEQATDRSDMRRSALESLSSVIEAVPDYLIQADPQSVNVQLNQLIERIVIQEDSVRLVFR
jgi:PAS domain-containing protein